MFIDGREITLGRLMDIAQKGLGTLMNVIRGQRCIQCCKVTPCSVCKQPRPGSRIPSRSAHSSPVRTMSPVTKKGDKENKKPPLVYE